MRQDRCKAGHAHSEVSDIQAQVLRLVQSQHMSQSSIYIYMYVLQCAMQHSTLSANMGLTLLFATLGNDCAADDPLCFQPQDHFHCIIKVNCKHRVQTAVVCSCKQTPRQCRLQRGLRGATAGMVKTGNSSRHQMRSTFTIKLNIASLNPWTSP